ncbi:hypothetical protein F4821DRAFT_232984 [Hypoxylon rubiginosum]|uniref:Uncharacterized protein n=1 Tax=Hypoxylon rubiginosum TaxID=110542 RepID=A0ACC0D7S8_9PEZI|nr:hypothetical protein F4821DRAFT_232984 [Hypoxylon rubiginosum]
MYKYISRVLDAFGNLGLYIRSLVPSPSSTRTPRTAHLPSAVDQNITGVASAPRSAELPDGTPMSEPDRTSGAAVLVVVEKGRLFYLIHVDITDRNPVQTVIQEVRLAAEIFVHPTYLPRLLHSALYHQQMSIATAPAVPNAGSRVAIDAITSRQPVDYPRLTDGVELDGVPFTERYPMVTRNGSDSGSDSPVSYLLVETKLKKHVVLMCSFAAVVASIVVGVLVGLTSRNAAYGIAATAGMVGIIAFLVQLLTWAVAV